MEFTSYAAGGTTPGIAPMIGHILQGTPVWVWPLLAVLLVLGLSQARDRSAGTSRITLLPVAMTVLSLAGTMSVFRGSSHLALVLAIWLAAAASAFAAMARLAPPAGTRYDAVTRTFLLPGSWVPLLLILAIFALRYAVGTALALQPALIGNTAFATGIGALYGVFSGTFGGRAARLWRLAHRAGARLPIPLPT